MGTTTKINGMNKDASARTQVQQARGPIAPRLLDLDGTASYLSVSKWTIRDLEAANILPRVRVPLANNGELRKILFDRNDLDALIEKWKDRKVFNV